VIQLHFAVFVSVVLKLLKNKEGALGGSTASLVQAKIRTISFTAELELELNWPTQ